MSKVFVIDTNKQPLDPVHPGYARLLLKQGKAAVFRLFPFTIILKKAFENPKVEKRRIKIDPGAKTTGLAMVNDCSGEVIFAAELTHRGFFISESLKKRSAVRRNRRNRKTRYRKARFQNRRNKKQGWLPPSLQSRMQNIITWVSRLRKCCNIAAISLELVKFDLQKMENPEIAGVEYQQGTLYGYEMREYLLEKWKRKCTYCQKENIPLQIEHIHPRSKGGTDRLSNLCLACEKCNQTKGNRAIEDFLKKKPERLKEISSQAKITLKDATAVNAIRWELYRKLQIFGIPIECGSGGLTKYNRSTRGLSKSHWIDAACVGKSTPENVAVEGVKPLLIVANGHGRRQMCRMDKHGFVRSKSKEAKYVNGFQTGDMVKAVVLKGKKIGTYTGRVAIRTNGYFNISTKQKIIQGIHYQYCKTIHRMDGYSYQKGERHSSHA